MRHAFLLLLPIAALLTACGDDDKSSSDEPGREDATDIIDTGDDAPDGDDVAEPEEVGDVADVAPDAEDVGADVPADTAQDAADVAEEVAPDAPEDAEDTRPPECPELPEFDYSCDGSDPDSCPEGLCLFGQCLAPVVNEDRWATCGDGECDPCEVAELCPVDCMERPTLVRPRDFDNDTTVTIEVHGFNPVDGGEWEETVYGEIDSAGGMGELIQLFAPDVPDGQRDGAEGPQQMIGVEYYGAIPAEWLSEEDIAEIEAEDPRTDRALHRYALVVGKFINWYTEQIGATDVNLFCHSMGCHVTRYMIENDVEGVASSGMIARWSTTSGVIAGARLARLFDNPGLQGLADILSLNTADFIHMNPDYVTDHSASWDHQPHAGNNPLFEDMLIHHLAATDPTLQETLDILPLLDLNNPEGEPNDGLVYTWDEMFREQDESVRHEATTGERVLPTASYQNVDHFEIKEQTATGILHAAGLYHRRKVWIVLRSITLLDDFEKDSIVDFSQSGNPPADISFQADVSYDPYVSDTFGQNGFVHTQAPEDRSTPLVELVEGRSTSPNWTIFEGPVFDDQETVRVDFELLEMDRYPRFGVTELGFDLDPHDALVTWVADVPLEDDLIVIDNGNARVEIQVTVLDMY